MQKSQAERDRLQAQAKAYTQIMQSKAAIKKPVVYQKIDSKPVTDFIEPEGEIDYSKYVRNK